MEQKEEKRGRESERERVSEKTPKMRACQRRTAKERFGSAATGPSVCVIVRQRSSHTALPTRHPALSFTQTEGGTASLHWCVCVRERERERERQKAGFHCSFVQNRSNI